MLMLLFILYISAVNWHRSLLDQRYEKPIQTHIYSQLRLYFFCYIYKGIEKYPYRLYCGICAATTIVRGHTIFLFSIRCYRTDKQNIYEGKKKKTLHSQARPELIVLARLHNVVSRCRGHSRF